MTALAAEVPAPIERSVPEPVVHARPVDEARAAAAVGDLLAALGLNPADPGLADTPGRVARMFAELLTPEPLRPTTFPNDGYLPGERIIGLSKLARTVPAR